MLVRLRQPSLRNSCLRNLLQRHIERGLILVASQLACELLEAFQLLIRIRWWFHRLMYLCFIDESGTPPKPTAKRPRPYFVIAGVIIHEAQWHEIAKEVAQLRRRREFQVHGEIKWRYFGTENDDPANPLLHLSPDKRDEFRRLLFEILTRRRSVKIIGCVSHVHLAYQRRYVKDEEDLYFHTYKPVSERFLYHLQDVTRDVGAKQFGILVADHRGKKQDDGLRSSHHRLVEDESSFTSKYGNFVETVFMTPSHLSIGIQFADMVAGAIGRGFNSADWTFYRLIKSAIRTDASGAVEGHGIAKFPAGWKWEPPGGGPAP